GAEGRSRSRPGGQHRQRQDCEPPTTHDEPSFPSEPSSWRPNSTLHDNTRVGRLNHPPSRRNGSITPPTGKLDSSSGWILLAHPERRSSVHCSGESTGV